MSDHDDVSAQPQVPTPRSSLSYSSGSSISPSTSSSNSSKSAVSECLGAWINYLQVLNNLCASGYRLAQTVTNLEQWANQEQQPLSMQPGPSVSQPSQLTLQIITAWDDLARATTVATGTVKTHIITVLQDFVTQSLNTFEQESDVQRVRERNQQIVTENAQTLINIQHQFCMASCDSFSSLMCCFVCQTPIGFPHDQDCAIIQQQGYSKVCGGDPRSQTPSPHFGMAAMLPNTRMPNDSRGMLFDRGSSSTQGSSDHSCALTGTGLEQTRGPSPHHEIRGPSPIQGFLDNIRGPLPNPGHLLGMKAPFYRGSKSPLNFPLFPLNGQRRWSEAAAGQVSEESSLDAESQMRRWSMPWEASKTDKNTVSWHQTRIMPISKLAVPSSKTGNESWQSSVTSQDGLAEAIQLLSCRPNNRVFQQPQAHSMMGPPFIEEPHSSNVASYGIWTARPHDRLPYIKFPKEQDKSFDENPPP